MRRGWKTFWVVCTVVAGIGFACCLIAMALGVTADSIEERFPNASGFIAHHANNGMEVFNRKPYDGIVDNSETLANVHSVDAQIGEGELQILRSDTDQVKIETSGVDPRMKFKYYMEDGELIIETARHLVGDVQSGTIYLFLPQDYKLEEAEIVVNKGYLYIEEILADNLDISIGAGEADIAGFRADDATLECGAGTLNAYGVGRESDYGYSVYCGIGEVAVGRRQYSGIAVSRDEELGDDAERVIDIRCGIGTVTVNFDETL